jgi:hypothetical protein
MHHGCQLEQYHPMCRHQHSHTAICVWQILLPPEVAHVLFPGNADPAELIEQHFLTSIASPSRLLGPVSPSVSA